MAVEENKAIVQRYYAELNRGNRAIVDELIAEGYTVHDPSLPPDMCAGRDALKAAIEMSQSAFPGHQMTIEDLFGEGDRVAARLTFHGRQAGMLDGGVVSGSEITFTGIGIFRLEGGQIAEGWFNFDQYGLMQQLEAARSD